MHSCRFFFPECQLWEVFESIVWFLHFAVGRLCQIFTAGKQHVLNVECDMMRKVFWGAAGSRASVVEEERGGGQFAVVIVGREKSWLCCLHSGYHYKSKLRCCPWSWTLKLNEFLREETSRTCVIITVNSPPLIISRSAVLRLYADFVDCCGQKWNELHSLVCADQPSVAKGLTVWTTLHISVFLDWMAIYNTWNTRTMTQALTIKWLNQIKTPLVFFFLHNKAQLCK